MKGTAESKDGHAKDSGRWGLVAARIPGRKAEEIERYWIMRHGESFAEKRLKREAGGGGRCEGRRAP
ncbi:hypothetical protein C4D60_Mb08t05110 [Musa balbisiana]|uniref:Myb-like domain-containing protein n=1 Tax=Musa balbisiana TaxID=52838 RepID=A0A4S8K1K0_MUSBA|nr:hypothetical protein C4D60_Mb08t05110 [Musa balbisiana]